MFNKKSEKTAELVTVLSDNDLDSVTGGSWGGFWNTQYAGSYNINTNIAQNNSSNYVSFNVG